MNLFNEINKQIKSELKILRDRAQYSKDDVLQMRLNNDKRLYKNPSDVILLYGSYVWENGKVGYFKPFNHAGLRFVQTEKDSIMLVFPQCNKIIISGFGEYVLRNWGSDLSQLCEEYTVGRYRKIIEQWKKENYPNEMDHQTAFQLLNELKETEQNRWDQATISDFFTSNDNEKLNQCMATYFEWFEGYINELVKNSQKPKQITPENSTSKKDVVYKLNLSEELEIKVLKNFKFWKETKAKHKNDPAYKDIFDETTQQHFLEMVINADFSEQYNKPAIKQRVGYNVVVLSLVVRKFLNINCISLIYIQMRLFFDFEI